MGGMIVQSKIDGQRPHWALFNTRFGMATGLGLRFDGLMPVLGKHLNWVLILMVPNRALNNARLGIILVPDMAPEPEFL